MSVDYKDKSGKLAQWRAIAGSEVKSVRRALLNWLLQVARELAG
jgi:hypothetical protein